MGDITKSYEKMPQIHLFIIMLLLNTLKIKPSEQQQKILWHDYMVEGKHISFSTLDPDDVDIARYDEPWNMCIQASEGEYPKTDKIGKQCWNKPVKDIEDQER